MSSSQEDALARLVAEHGSELLEDARRVKAFLQDEFPEQRRDTALLVAAVEEGIAARLQGAIAAGHSGSQIDLLVAQLVDDRGLSPEAARWAVATWYAALQETGAGPDSEPGYEQSASSTDEQSAHDGLPGEAQAPRRNTTAPRPEPDARTAGERESVVGASASRSKRARNGFGSAMTGGIRSRPLPMLAAGVVGALLLLLVLGVIPPDPPPPPPIPTPSPTPIPTPSPSPSPSPTPTPTPSPSVVYLEELESDCGLGDYSACDELYYESPIDSDFEDFGSRCGNYDYARTNGNCASTYDISTAYEYGDDPYLDFVTDQCVSGDMFWCDVLYEQSASGSWYEEVGATCNGLVPDWSAVGSCEQTIT